MAHRLSHYVMINSLNDLYEYFLRLKKGFLTLLPQEAFTFIITRENGKYNFGYCLIENDFNGNISTVHCILRFVFLFIIAQRLITIPWISE